MIGARLADEHLLTGQIVHRGDRRRARPGDHHLAHVGARRLREGDELLQLGPDGHHGRDHVDLAAREGRIQLIARHRHDHHVHLEVARLQVLVQIVLERLQGLVGDPALLPLVDEVVRAVERHGHANRAALDHLVEVAGERLVHHEPHAFRQGVVRRRRLRDRRFGRGRCRRRRPLLLTRAGRGGRHGQQDDDAAADAGSGAFGLHGRGSSVHLSSGTSIRAEIARSFPVARPCSRGCRRGTPRRTRSGETASR